VLFAPTVESAYHFADVMNEHGIRAATIVGETSREDRALIYKQYEAGEIDVLTNAMVLTEGWDSPATEVAVIARPTQNPGLYTQMVGRVLRPFPGKMEALVLDVVGIAGQHRLQSLTTLTKVEIKPGESLTEAQERAEREHADAAERGKIVEGARGARSRTLRRVTLGVASDEGRRPVHSGPRQRRGRLGRALAVAADRLVVSRDLKVRSQQGVWKVRGVEFEYALSPGASRSRPRLDPTVATKDRAWRRAKPSEVSARSRAAHEARAGSMS
jgi:superfamily II DNA or RNA helicase